MVSYIMGDITKWPLKTWSCISDLLILGWDMGLKPWLVVLVLWSEGNDFNHSDGLAPTRHVFYICFLDLFWFYFDLSFVFCFSKLQLFLSTVHWHNHSNCFHKNRKSTYHTDSFLRSYNGLSVRCSGHICFYIFSQ